MSTPLLSPESKSELGLAVRQAGQELLRYWPGKKQEAQAADLKTKTKQDGSLVSEADLASNAILSAALKRLFPADAFHSEEIPPGAELYSARRIWVVDPLDGTSVFLRGSNEFSILVALLVDGYPEFGIMHFPALGLYLEASRGNGAYLNGERLQVSPSPQLRTHGVYARIAGQFPKEDCFVQEHLDSGFAFLKLLRGQLDGIIFQLTHLREWDLAAPSILVEEAGGEVSNQKRERMSFLPGSLPQYFLASNKLCHQQLLPFV